jgi:hypothetical protein
MVGYLILIADAGFVAQVDLDNRGMQTSTRPTLRTCPSAGFAPVFGTLECVLSVRDGIWIAASSRWMRVRLIRKLAEVIDGVDLSAHNPGDLLDLPESHGRLLVAEHWAIPERRIADRSESARHFMPRSSQVEKRETSSGAGRSGESATKVTHELQSVAADRPRKAFRRGDRKPDRDR